MGRGESEFIRLSLIRTKDQAFTPQIEVEGHSMSVDTPIPIGTPGTPIEAAFGSEYSGIGIARIAATAFECTLSSPEFQSLEQPRLDWIWNCSSDSVGSHYVNLSLYVRWESVDKTDNAIEERQIWRNQIPITVFEPWVSKGQISIGSLFSGFLGTVFSASWLYDRYKDTKEKPKEDKPKIIIARK
jgi:hypothetical protein